MAGFDPSQSGRRRSSNRTTTAAVMMFFIRWTAELHLILLQAIRFLGDNEEVVVPSKVLEVMMNDEKTKDVLKKMNVQKLTREHVASHLQKLRQFLYTETIRKNKFAKWHLRNDDIKQGHEDIKRRQLVTAPPNSSHRRRRNSANPNNNHVSVIPSFGDNNVVAAAGNNCQSMACFADEENIINSVAAATPTIDHPIYSPHNNNIVGFGQHLTGDFIYNNNNNYQEQGFGETCQLQGINHGFQDWNEEDCLW